MSVLKKALRHMRRFGPGSAWQALRLYSSNHATTALRLPGFRQPIWARTGTSDVATFDEVFMAREYDIPFPDFSPRHIVDLGANIGYASLYFAARWPRARVLAVEPDADNLAMLERNTRSWPQITRLHGAVWAHPARLAVANPGADSNAFRMQEFSADSDSAIEAYTVSQLIDLTGSDRLDLLKMDVEGAEREILQHSSDWLDRVNVMIVELHDRLLPGCAEALCHALEGRRFHLEILGANLAVDFR